MESTPPGPLSAPSLSRLERGVMIVALAAVGAILTLWYLAQWLGLPWFARSAPLGTVAPAAAVALTALTATLAYVLAGRRHALLDVAGLGVVSAVGLAAVVFGTYNLLHEGASSPPENAFAAWFPDPRDGLPRRLSVFGAVAITLSAFVLALHLTGVARQPRWSRLGAAIAVLTATILLYAAASRLIGVTLIAVGKFSLSFWTAAALGLLNVALAVSLHACGEARRLLLGDTALSAAGPPSPRSVLPLVLLGSLIITALALLWYLHSHFTRSRREQGTLLANIARLQGMELDGWRRERLGDAAVLQHSPSLAHVLTSRTEAVEAVTAYFEAFRHAYGYEAIALLNRDFEPLLHSGSPEVAAAVAAEVRRLGPGTAAPRWHDPLPGADEVVWLDVIAPLSPDAANRPRGFVALRIDARPQLTRMLTRWGAAGANTVALYPRAGQARYLGYPGTEAPPWDTLAAAVGRNREFDLGEFRDHRDVPVLALAKRVPDSPWILAAKIDRATADAEVRSEAWRLGAGFLGVSLALGLAAQAVWRQRRYELERQHLLAERERHAAVERLTGVAALVPGVVYQYQLFPDGRSCFPYASEAIRQIYRVTPEEVRTDASAVFRILHPDDYESIVASIRRSARTLEPWIHEYRVRFEDGTVRWLHGHALPRTAPDGSVLWHGFISDVTARKQVDEALLDSLREKEALLKEVHHRVKNNLQVVSSLLRMEVRRNRDTPAAAVLQDMMGRVHSMALLHEALYRTDNFAAVELGSYIRRIATESQRTAAVQAGAVKLVLDLGSVQVDLDRAQPCGLLLNELVSNAYKHGFPTGGPGEIRVTLQPTDNPPHWRLRVSDNGVGLPADLETRRRSSLGLELVADLATQLGGRLAIGPGPGATFEIVFPIHPLAAPPGPPAAAEPPSEPDPRHLGH